jgi:hypothetical protein
MYLFAFMNCPYGEKSKIRLGCFTLHEVVWEGVGGLVLRMGLYGDEYILSECRVVID